MSQEEYKRLVERITPKENKLKNIMIAFLIGGLIGFFGEFFIYIVTESFGLSQKLASMWLCLTIIFIGTLLTCLGSFDNYFTTCKCGLIIPTTGFAHSITSCALEFKKEGLITGLGSNFFKLAGSVIIYGIISSFVFTVIEVLLNG